MSQSGDPVTMLASQELVRSSMPRCALPEQSGCDRVFRSRNAPDAGAEALNCIVEAVK